ncbi:DUF5667 domain-containing protein [Streptomyces camelliae]|uniref:DUF5667 domain-containing protein n=1 Tax=Streptomyces camelliae TaxID=3004093 RepID=A0ABY7P501_9ACTN|nr:DUF5667 domain-containing protein [Streptomyces sp. HUAS 2-6]WBO64645.1 DUF5667 domain-containing protein [Streptomyces sp. HUAS 2-6]
MIANVSAHRRANAFAQALDEQSDRDTAAERSAPAESPPATEEQSEQGELLALAAGLGALPKPQLDPEVKVVQRAQLVAAMEAMLQEGTGAADASVPNQKGSEATSLEGRWRETGGRAARSRGAHRAGPLGKLRPRSRLTKGLAAGGLSVGVAAGAFGGVAAASSDALPGDSLYGLKRGIEDFKLNYLTDGDNARGQTYLDQASTRLSEARRLLERGRGGHLDHESIGEIRRTLSGMQSDVTEGHRLLHEAYEADPDSLGPIQALSTFSRSHREAWSALSDRLPVQLGDVKQQVSSVFDAIDQEVAPLESRLPKPPTGTGTGTDQGTGSTSTGPSGTHRGSATPSSSGSTPSTGRHARPDDPTGPATSTTGDGLIGGNTGGLLDPPKTGTGGNTTQPTGKPSTPAPDVTLPPLLPGLLPGLGIQGEETN